MFSLFKNPTKLNKLSKKAGDLLVSDWKNIYKKHLLWSHLLLSLIMSASVSRFCNSKVQKSGLRWTWWRINQSASVLQTTWLVWSGSVKMAAPLHFNMARQRSFCLLLPVRSVRRIIFGLVVVCVLVKLSLADESDFKEDFLKREYSLVKPYRGKSIQPGRHVRSWQVTFLKGF